MLVDSIVIGAGQAGLAAAWHLQRAGLSFEVLEAGADAAGSWPHYYDSLRLFSPGRYCSLPGMPFPGPADAYPTRDEVVRYLRGYAAHFGFPIRTGQRVVRVERRHPFFAVHSADGAVRMARTVIAASGAFTRPHVPDLQGLPAFRGRVLHSRDYRSPVGIEGRRIVVVGGANSAVQIAAELAERNRVSLATRRAVRFVPQRILGRDFHFWLGLTGLDRTRWLSDQSTPVLDDGRHARALRVGRPDRRPMFERLTEGGVVWRDGRSEPVDMLVLATGFLPNVDYLAELEPLDAQGRLRQRGGIGATPGLYYIGFARQRNFASATLRGVGPDAEAVVGHLARMLARPDPRGPRRQRMVACCD